MHRICSDCKKDKLISEYHKWCYGKDDYRGICKNCTHKRTHSYYLRHKETILERSRDDKLTLKNRRLKNRFGITYEEYQQLLKSQNEVCKICQKKESTNTRTNNKIRPVDHDHKTKKVRGILCDSCNKGLGNLRDDINLLLAAIEYLKDAQKEI